MAGGSGGRVLGRSRRWVLVCGLMAMVVGAPAGVVVSPAAGGGGPVPQFVIAYQSEKVMDVPGGSTAQGVQMVQWTAHGEPNQEWLFLPFGSAHVVVSSLSGMVLDVSGASTADGAVVVQWPWAGTPNQVWFVAPFANTSVIISASSGKVLDVSGASLDDGAPLIQFSWLGGFNQLWDLFPSSRFPTGA